MPGKSRHGRGKHLSRGKKRKGRRSPLAIAAQQQVATQTYKPVSQPEVSAPSAGVPTPAPTTARYPYITTELRRIGILGGIMLAILVGLALVLS